MTTLDKILQRPSIQDFLRQQQLLSAVTKANTASTKSDIATTDIEQLQGTGPNPAGFVQELFGVFPLSRVRADVVRESGADTEEITVNGIAFQFPKDTQRMFKGHHDTVRVPTARTLPADISATMLEDPASYTQQPFHDMQFGINSERTTQSKVLYSVMEIPSRFCGLHDGAYQDALTPEILGYRVHITDSTVFYAAYNHPTDRTEASLVCKQAYRASQGAYVHESDDSVLVLVEEAEGNVLPYARFRQSSVIGQTAFSGAAGKAYVEDVLAAPWDEKVVNPSELVCRSSSGSCTRSLWLTLLQLRRMLR